MTHAFHRLEEYHKNGKVLEDVVGMKTFTGIKITGQSKHFMERVIKTEEELKTHRPRSGVKI